MATPDPTPLHEQVPAEDRGTFDELLADKHGEAYGMRDDNGPLPAEWPEGLLRRAFLEAGRRLAGRGRLDEERHVFELETAQVGRGAGRRPGAERSGCRGPRRPAAPRSRGRRPEPAAGPPMPPPDTSAFPRGHPPRVMNIIIAAVSNLEADPSVASGDLRGLGIGTSSHRGVAHVAIDPDRVLDVMEPGDVLVAPWTAPSYNAVLAIAGGIVVQEGGLLSHAAVMARELGIPAVIGCRRRDDADRRRRRGRRRRRRRRSARGRALAGPGGLDNPPVASMRWVMSPRSGSATGIVPRRRTADAGSGDQARGRSRCPMRSTRILDAGRSALSEFRGPHAEIFAAAGERRSPPRSSACSSPARTPRRGVSWFPAQPASSSIAADYAYRGARVYAASSGGSLSADVDALHSFARVAGDQSGAFNGLAAAVTTSGLWADVSVLRGLNSAERERWEAQGVPGFEIDSARVWADPQPDPIGEVFGLPDLGGQASLVASTADELAAWTAAVAYALENADRALQSTLLMKYPELAGYLDRATLTEGTDDRRGSAARRVGEPGPVRHGRRPRGRRRRRGRVVRPGGHRQRPPAHRRTCAPPPSTCSTTVCSSAWRASSTGRSPMRSSPERRAPHRRRDRRVPRVQRRRAGSVGIGFDRLDTAAEGGATATGIVSPEDLHHGGGGGRVPRLRSAMRPPSSLANPLLTQRLGLYDHANFDRARHRQLLRARSRSRAPRRFWGFFTRDGVIALAIDQQAYASDPAAARQFVGSGCRWPTARATVVSPSFSSPTRG